MRTLPPFGEELVKQIEAAWEQPQEDWKRKRLLVVRLIAQHELTTEAIAKVAGVSRKSVFNYRDQLVSEPHKPTNARRRPACQKSKNAMSTFSAANPSFFQKLNRPTSTEHPNALPRMLMA